VASDGSNPGLQLLQANPFGAIQIVADHPDCNLASVLAFPNGSQATLQLGKLLLRGQINARSGVNAASVENIRCMWSGCQRANSARIAEKKTP
jgi:hypothetical protein